MITKDDFSFSTMWNLRKHTEGRAMMEEIKALGFRQVELNYNVTEAMLASIKPMVEEGDIQISSVHHVFPHIDDKTYDTDSVMLGFDDPKKRARAVALLKRSVDHAVQLGARGVVVHPGEVPFDYNVDTALKKVWIEQGKDSSQYQQMWQAMMEQRELLAPLHVRRIRESLEEVCEYIVQGNLGIEIGIETRSRCYQLPTLREAAQIIDELNGAPVGLWFDIGHGMMMERMGLYDNLPDLALLMDKVLGVHIHETVELVDHWCPYVHSKDLSGFDVFLPVIAAASIKVYELRAPCTEEEIEESYQIMSRKLAESGLMGS